MKSLFNDDCQKSHSDPKAGHKTIRHKLTDLAHRNVLINEVSLSNGQSLYGVEVKDVEADYAVFHESGSAGISKVIVPLHQIVYLDTDQHHSDKR